MSTNDQATRPSSAREAALWDIAAQVPDPEIPVISIADLGISVSYTHLTLPTSDLV